ncbi:hypothetical protein BDW59DRAFT_31168 [Aspergillus cavernicola]|uniref:DUF202 domain-containing protein n=1 Tax=Aspergillus cavernicola TaxID=176166 RepID=A0ABR4HDA0_9EURO
MLVEDPPDPDPLHSQSQSQSYPVANLPESSSQTRTSPVSSSPCNCDDLDPDFLELHEIETQHEDESIGSLSSGEYRIVTRRTVSRASQSSRLPREGVLGSIQRFWTRNVVLTVQQKRNRDHFALERTFLAYIRTSVVLAMQGVFIAQLFRLQSVSTIKGLGYHEVGVPLSVTCHGAAILTAALGAHRFWKQQGAIALGMVYAGGWELNVIGFLTTSVGIPIAFQSKDQQMS